MWEGLARMIGKINVRCSEHGFDCAYSITGEVDKVVFDFWDHMKIQHGIEYSPGTVGTYMKKKIPSQIPVE